MTLLETNPKGKRATDTTPRDSIVRVSGLTHCYGSHVALDNVTLDVEVGSILALLGPNGGGKTTLFKILTTALTATDGTASIDDLNVLSQRAEVRHRIGIVFQQPSLDKKLTVRENMLHQGHLYGMSGMALSNRVAELLPRLGIEQRANDRIDTLSGGLQRRVELAKALLHRPRVLILDEPSTGLDPAARKDLMTHLHELRDQDGVTVLLTTHLMDEADRCDRVALLDRGRLVALDSPESLKATIGGEVLTILTAEPRGLANRIQDWLHSDVQVADDLVHIEHPRGRDLVPDLMNRFGEEISSIQLGKPTLEDVFLRLTGHKWSDESDKDGGEVSR